MTEQPLLAVVYNPRSRPWTEVVDAASGICRLLWLVDSSQEGVGIVSGVLRKSGQIVDVAGRTPQEIVQLVYAHRPDGVTSFSDDDLHQQAWLAEALDLPTPSVRSATMLTDKLLQREALDAAGLPVPKFSAIREPADAQEVERLCAALTFPMILKPRDGMACRDISSVANADELARLLKEVQRPGQMILEDRMQDDPSTDPLYADRVSIDSIMSHGTISHLGITGLFAMVPPFRSSGGFFPADISASDVTDLLQLATGCIHALGSGFGCYRTEIKLTPQGRKIIEVNGRPTGLGPATVKLAAGVPLLQLCIRLALGEHIVIDGPVACDRVAYRYYREPPMSAERVLAITGIDELRALPGVVQVDLHKGIGDPVDWHNGSLDKVFQVTGAVANHAELAEHYRACTSNVVVTYQHHAGPS